MPDCEITCIIKPHPSSPHEHITHVGNPPTWVWTSERVIASIDGRTNTFFVRDPRTGKRADVEVIRRSDRIPFLQTRADGILGDNLLSLNQCPYR